MFAIVPIITLMDKLLKLIYEAISLSKPDQCPLEAEHDGWENGLTNWYCTFGNHFTFEVVYELFTTCCAEVSP